MRARARPGRGCCQFCQQPKEHIHVLLTSPISRLKVLPGTFRKHFNKGYICNEYVLEIDAGRDDVKTICSYGD